MISLFWPIFGVATALKVLLIPAYHSTDFEVHRNWLAVTHSLPLHRWYVDETSEWTLDYPPLFAYFEWALAQVARLVDPEMLVLQNLNYASVRCKLFQRFSVIATDVVFAIGVLRCLRSLRTLTPRLCTEKQQRQQLFSGALLLLCNVGLLFVDHIHFQYNGLLFGLLLISIGFLLEERCLLAAITFAALLCFKHIFLYMAPAFAVYLLKFYCLNASKNPLFCVSKLAVVGVVPFVVAFGPFWRQLPQVFARLFPFKRGLTHAYWAPNFWAIYNAADKVAAVILRRSSATSNRSSTSGLVQQIEHVVLPSVTPTVTFFLTALFMTPILVKLLCYTPKSESKTVFLRAIVLCSCASFMFGWHVHEKAILMCLIPMCLLCLTDATDAKFAFLLSVVGYFSLFPLLFDIDLLLVRYLFYLAYITAMFGQLVRLHKAVPQLHCLEIAYLCGFVLLPLYEHVLSPMKGLNERFPFMPLLLTSLYCSVGVMYFFIRYYCHALCVGVAATSITKSKSKSKNNSTKSKVKTK